MKTLRQIVIIALTGILAVALFQRAYELHRANNELERLVTAANSAFRTHGFEQPVKQEHPKIEWRDCGNRRFASNEPFDFGHSDMFVKDGEQICEGELLGKSWQFNH